MKPNGKLIILAGLLVAVLGNGCSDSDDDNGVGNEVPLPIASDSIVPDSASTSNSAFISYVRSLGVADESSEPLGIKESFAVPADEENEPLPLI